MINALKKVWTAFFFAVMLFPVAAVVAGLANIANPRCVTCGGRIGSTFWLIGVTAHHPLLQVNNLSFLRQSTIWFIAVAAGFVTYVGLRVLAAGLVASGNVRGLQPGSAAILIGVLVVAANLIGVLVAFAGSSLLVRYRPDEDKPRHRRVATGQSTQQLERKITVSREGVQNESQTQRDRAPVGSLRVRATALERISIALKIVGKAVVSVVLLSYLADAIWFSARNSWAILIAAPALFYLWASVPRRARVRDRFRHWLSRDWRLVPFYAAAILVSIAALRYILSE